MHYIFLLILLLITIPAREIQAQERIAYRVEVIILRLVQSDFEPLSSPELREFTGVLDLENESLQRDSLLEQWLNPVPESIFELEATPPLTPVATQFSFLDGMTHVSAMSEQMSSVWRNLRLSGEYRPEVYLAWEQEAEGSFPALRVHNQEVIRIDDDHEDLRFDSLTTGPTISVPDPENPLEDLVIPRPEPEFFNYDLESGTLESAPLPEPVEHFTVDGEVRLRRSRFLHIDLDIEFRQPSPARSQGISGPLLPEYQGYQVQPLKQSRQVRTGRMEYFDSPVLGALVWVTGIDALEEESDP
jgi:hypothetical protein